MTFRQIITTWIKKITRHGTGSIEFTTSQAIKYSVTRRVRVRESSETVSEYYRDFEQVLCTQLFCYRPIVACCICATEACTCTSELTVRRAISKISCVVVYLMDAPG